MNKRCGATGSVNIEFERQRTLVFKTLWLCGLIALGLGAGTAIAQPVSPHGAAGAASGVADIPAGAASIRGRVVHESDSSAVAGVPIVLYSLSPDGTPGLRGMVSADDGTFAFEKVAGDASIVYLVGARYREVPFGIRMSFEPGETERKVELTIGEPTTDNSAARIAEVLIRVDQGCDGLLIKESHSLENTGDLVIYVPEAERAGRAPILRVPVPAGATHLESTVGDSLDWDGQTISYWGPLRPGREELEFAYGLPAGAPGGETAIEIEHDFPSGVGRVRVFSHESGPTLSSPAGGSQLEAGLPIVLDGVSHSVLEASDLAAGAAFTLRAELRPIAGVSDAIVGEESRIWLDLDGAALTVDEQHQLSVSGSEPLTSASGAPLLCFALDPRAEELQFSNDTLALGLSRDPSGAVAVRGPIPAGASPFALRYRIPVDSDVVPFVREFPFEISLLSILISDTGLVIETPDLHRRRPVRTEDRKYLYLEAFGVKPSAKVRLSIEPFDIHRPMPQWASAGIALMAGLFAIGFLTVPLRGVATASTESLPTYFAEERQSVLSSLRSLEDDFETGKLSQADYAELRQQLRATAVNLLALERDNASRDSAQDSSQGKDVEIAAAAARACGACKAELAPDAIFCSKCGTRVSEESPSAGNSA